MDKKIANLLTMRFDIKTAVLLRQANGWLLVWAVRYLPFDYPKECYSIDGYYLVSNFCYNQTKEIISFLGDLGIEATVFKGNYKLAAVKLGLGKQLRNQLVLIDSSTFCYLSAIGFGELDFDNIKENEIDFVAGAKTEENIFCHSCNKCENACPSGALKGKWQREKCLRQVQEDGGGELLKNKTNLLGCDICQRVCPYNAHIKTISPPAELKEFLQINNILQNIQDKQKISYLAQLIGTNYAKEKKLLPVLKWLQGGDDDIKS